MENSFSTFNQKKISRTATYRIQITIHCFKMSQLQKKPKPSLYQYQPPARMQLIKRDNPGTTNLHDGVLWSGTWSEYWQLWIQKHALKQWRTQ
jgi:hypothetical protein